MKVLFGTDITQNKKNEQSDGDEFIVRSVPQAISEKHNKEIESEIDQAFSAARGFGIFQLVGGILLFAGLFGIFETFDSNADLSFSYIKEAIAQNKIWFLAFTGIFILGVLITAVCEVKRKKSTAQNNEQSETKDAEDEKYVQQTLTYLGVPQSAKNVDIICSDYVIKKGEPVLKPMKTFGLLNAELKLFSDENSLFIADAENLYSVRLTDILKISRYDGKLHLMFWNKDTEYNEEKYKEYNIKKQGEFSYTVKTYYSLDISREGEIYKMYFPPYELDVIEKLTGIRYEE